MYCVPRQRVCQGAAVSNQVSQWTLPSGLLVSVCRVSDRDRRWTAHVLSKTLSLVEHRSPQVHGSSGAIIFECQGWFILTRKERLQPLQEIRHVGLSNL